MRAVVLSCLTIVNVAHATPARSNGARVGDGVGAALSIGAFGALAGAHAHTQRGGFVDFNRAEGFALGSILGGYFIPALYDAFSDGDGAVGASMLGNLTGSMTTAVVIAMTDGEPRDELMYLLGAASIAGAGIGFAVGDPLTLTPTVLPDGEARALGLGFGGAF